MASMVDRRSDRLARRLYSLGLNTGDRLVVLCCEKHPTDGVVGYCGAKKADLAPNSAPDGSSHRVAALLVALVATPAESWFAAKAPPGDKPASLVGSGDEPGVTWWKLPKQPISRLRSGSVAPCDTTEQHWCRYVRFVDVIDSAG
jgi:hypothetical protein